MPIIKNIGISSRCKADWGNCGDDWQTRYSRQVKEKTTEHIIAPLNQSLPPKQWGRRPHLRELKKMLMALF